jgi:hypothetical protein
VDLSPDPHDPDVHDAVGFPPQVDPGHERAEESFAGLVAEAGPEVGQSLPDVCGRVEAPFEGPGRPRMSERVEAVLRPVLFGECVLEAFASNAPKIPVGDGLPFTLVFPPIPKIRHQGLRVTARDTKILPREFTATEGNLNPRERTRLGVFPPRPTLAVPK